MISFFWITGIIGKSTAQKRDYIIPEDFKGTIKIVESKCGETPIIKKGRIQFNIPQNGIYLFNGELKSGYINERHYIQKKNGELVELKSKYFAIFVPSFPFPTILNILFYLYGEKHISQ